MKSFESYGWLKELRWCSNLLFSLSDDGKVNVWDLEIGRVKTFSEDQIGFKIFYFDVSSIGFQASFGSSSGEFQVVFRVFENLRVF